MIILVQHGEYSYDLLEIPEELKIISYASSGYLLESYRRWYAEKKPAYKQRSFTQWLKDQGAKEVSHQVVDEYGDVEKQELEEIEQDGAWEECW